MACPKAQGIRQNKAAEKVKSYSSPNEGGLSILPFQEGRQPQREQSQDSTQCRPVFPTLALLPLILPSAPSK